jgi:tetratricopeptide (TPR) repeat protein
MKNRVFIILCIAVVLCLSSCVTGVPATDVAPLYLNLGNAYFELGNYDKAVEAYLNAVELNPELARASFNLAKVYIEQQQLDEAKTILEALIREDPENEILLSTLAYVYSLDGEVDASISLYRDILDRNPQNQDALYNAGILYWRLEEYEQAKSYFYSVFELDPDDTSALYSLAKIEEQLGNTDTAIEFYEVYLENNADDTEVMQELAELYFSEDLFAKALEISSSILTIDETNPEILFMNAFIHFTVTGDSALGMEFLEKAVLAGFTDKERYLQLVENPDLLESEKVREYVTEKDLLPAE